MYFYRSEVNPKRLASLKTDGRKIHFVYQKSNHQFCFNILFFGLLTKMNKHIILISRSFCVVTILQSSFQWLRGHRIIFWQEIDLWFFHFLFFYFDFVNCKVESKSTLIFDKDCPRRQHTWLQEYQFGSKLFTPKSGKKFCKTGDCCSWSFKSLLKNSWGYDGPIFGLN